MKNKEKYNKIRVKQIKPKKSKKKEKNKRKNKKQRISQKARNKNKNAYIFFLLRKKHTLEIIRKPKKEARKRQDKTMLIQE